MIITIDCDENTAAVIRDALHNYYHEAKPLQSTRAHINANVCKAIADRLKLFFISGHSRPWFDGKLRISIQSER